MRDNYTAENLFSLLDSAGSPVTLDERGQIEEAVPEDMIPLKDWAKMHDLSPATARQKALRGGFRTARKIGRDWMISAGEPNPDHRLRLTAEKEPLLEGPVWFDQVMNYLLALNPNSLPDTWSQDNSHRDYCRKIYRTLRGEMHGNEKVLFDLICTSMKEQRTSVCFIPHHVIMDHFDDEAWHTTNSGSPLNSGITIDFDDYLAVLKNTVSDLLSEVVSIPIHHGMQDLYMPWYHSVTWRKEATDGLYFVPSDFFRTVMMGL
ncbi:hypothetical protein [[Clostridium] aminophilum]|uniref:Uncharacterized protein n=1 Tax=[Clostridium] aminophilum TaxID=1526 RepID=A0A1I6ILZ6_9FIRM|nr:hypothetical protein [[Clostridium] aminophilum]SFR67752.1 hypothetical protein SAMN02910262_00539 [[Clostridium] aminophilum]